MAGYFVPSKIFDAARAFKRDLVFTIAGSCNWTARLAQRVAQRLHVPLVASFNDWFDFGVLMHPRFRTSIEKNFRRFYRDCDLALCTSEGMLEALCPYRNAHVLYPTGGKIPHFKSVFVPFTNGRPATVFFAGSLSALRGARAEALSRACAHSPPRLYV